MSNQINGISFIHEDNYAICYVENFSDELKNIIRTQLSSVCNGVAKSKSLPRAYSYQSTLTRFLERYNSKSIETQKGMIGEFLVHILVLELFRKFEVVSPYFNMEEKSIRKGFDLLLYDKSLNEVWITEVKAGERHKNKLSDDTTSDLLSDAFSDLKKRLNKQEITFWDQAITSVRVVIEDEKDYKKMVEKILSDEIELASEKCATGKDNNVILVSVLFNNLNDKINESTVKGFSNNPIKIQEFKKLMIVSIQKNTYKKVVDFFKAEII